jgi:mannose-6-phosphate isomerase-like protein (cupin superfamily)
MEKEKGPALVIQPDEGPSFWQPVPANGYAEVRVSERLDSRVKGLCAGIQVIAPGSYVREHQHGEQNELLFFFEGTGKAIVDGVEHPLRPGTTLFFGPWRKHTFINEGPGDLKMFWVFLPGGLDEFFEAIGRRRTPGEAAPAPFPRPEDVVAIEGRTAFAPLDS